MFASDFLDVAVLAALIYVVLERIDRSVSSGPALRMLVTSVVLLALVVAARAAQLQLVSSFLTGVAIVYVVAILLVLQRDLRQMLDLVGNRLVGGDDAGADSGLIDTLTEAAFRLAEQRTGALVALRGLESWETLVHGGVVLDGALSEPLLYSLFDASTPGHDGAVLIDGDRVTRFGVHLPLATEVPQVSRFGGTRHAAALGLSMECDALVVVVSEETGAVHVAERGVLTRLDAAPTLRSRLERFRAGRRGQSVQRGRGWRRSGRALLAGSGAAVLWLLIGYSPDSVERSFDAPVVYQNVPSDWVVDANPDLVQLTLRGTSSAMGALASEDLVVAVDLSNPTEGTWDLTLREDQVALPKRVALLDTLPGVLRMTATPLERVALPVRVPLVGRLPIGLTLERIEVEPDQLTVMLPAGSAPPTGLITEVLDLSAINGPVTVERGVHLPARARGAADEPATVRVRVIVVESAPL